MQITNDIAGLAKARKTLRENPKLRKDMFDAIRSIAPKAKFLNDKGQEIEYDASGAEILAKKS